MSDIAGRAEAPEASSNTVAASTSSTAGPADGRQQVHAAPPPDWLGVHYAVRIFLSTTVLWIVLRLMAESDPIWAISSMIAVSEPQVKAAWQTFLGRIVNASLGCAVGLIFLLVGGTHEWVLPFALAATVLVSSYLIRVPTMWRQAPITAAIILTAGLSHHSKIVGLEYGLKRVAEVMLGCVVGLAVTWLISVIWPAQAKPAETQTQNEKPVGAAS